LVGIPYVSAALLAEASALGPDDYPSRALYGAYLQWTRDRIIWSASSAVSFVSHQASAVDLRDGGRGLQEVVLDSGETIADLHAVVLTLGHVPHRLGTSEAALGGFAERHGLRYVAPGNPADVALEVIPAGEPVILRGMGLNFFDYMALLTIGRGGTFTRRSDGAMRYVPSGREPHLVAGSRRGVPYQARGKNQKGPFGRHQPRYVTNEVIERFRARADAGAPASFRRDIWPLIDREVRTVYYATLVRERRRACDAEGFTDLFAAAEPALVPALGDPLAIGESDAERAVLAKFDVHPDEGWDWSTIAASYTEDDLRSTRSYRSWLRSYLDGEVREADKGNVAGPRKAALDVLRDLRNEIRLLVDHGGLSGDSYRDELQRWYTPLNAHLSIGPPVERLEQFAALVDAGVLEVLGPDLLVDCADGQFVAHSRRCPDLRVAASTLIEARLPEADVHRTTDPLLRTLLERGECRPYRIPIRGGGQYVAGGVAVTRRPYRLLDVEDRPHPRRFLFGVPTESVHWVTAAGIRPGVNSVILGDADAIARSCLQPRQLAGHGGGRRSEKPA
jgi:hypothetical protein